MNTNYMTTGNYTNLRVGNGIDIHQFVAGRKLILGGVEIPSDVGLLGHSDADVVIHALIDSILGALGLSDIGSFFPNTDPKWKDADSIKLLEVITKTKSKDILGTIDFKIINTDITILAEKPKILPYIAQMKEKIAGSLLISTSQVSIKATTAEKLGFVGRGEGVMAYVTTLLEKIEGE